MDKCLSGWSKQWKPETSGPSSGRGCGSTLPSLSALNPVYVLTTLISSLRPAPSYPAAHCLLSTPLGCQPNLLQLLPSHAGAAPVFTTRQIHWIPRCSGQDPDGPFPSASLSLLHPLFRPAANPYCSTFKPPPEPSCVLPPAPAHGGLAGPPPPPQACAPPAAAGGSAPAWAALGLLCPPGCCLTVTSS